MCIWRIFILHSKIKIWHWESQSINFVAQRVIWDSVSLHLFVCNLELLVYPCRLNLLASESHHCSSYHMQTIVDIGKGGTSLRFQVLRIWKSFSRSPLASLKVWIVAYAHFQCNHWHWNLNWQNNLMKI